MRYGVPSIIAHFDGKRIDAIAYFDRKRGDSECAAADSPGAPRVKQANEIRAKKRLAPQN
jgi:hypothetical protein